MRKGRRSTTSGSSKSVREALHKFARSREWGVARVTRAGARAAHLRRGMGDTETSLPPVRPPGSACLPPPPPPVPYSELPFESRFLVLLPPRLIWGAPLAPRAPFFSPLC